MDTTLDQVPDLEIALHLELVVNGESTGRVVPVIARGTHYLVSANDLHSVGLRRDVFGSATIDVTQFLGMECEYDQAAQRLILRVPAEWLPGQSVGRSGGVDRVAPQSSFGALVNYDVYVANSNRGGSFASMFNEVRVFGPFGIARTSGASRVGSSGNSPKTGFIRYDTNWTYVDENRLRTYEAGDLVTRTLGWSNPVRLGGVQISRDFSVRPDVVTYPVPIFSGTTAVPTAVELFINGYKTTTDTLHPGPFTLNETPYINGAGNAVVVTTDALGRQVSTSIPFYVANTLLRPGLSDYAFSVGTARRDYGVKDFSYSATVATGSWRYGLTDRLTIEGVAEAAASHKLVGAGGVFRLGNLGVVDASAAVSRQRSRTGRQVAVGYQFNSNIFSLTARRVWRTRDFGDLSTYAYRGGELARRQTQINGSVALGNIGTLGVGYIESLQQNDRFRLLSGSYNKSLWGQSSVYLTASYDLDGKNPSALVQLIIPLGRGTTGVVGVERTAGGSIGEQVNFSRAVPSDGGLGWSIGGANRTSEGPSYLADVTLRTDRVQLRGGLYGSRGAQTRWGEAGGSLVMMDGGIYAANRVNDAFVVINTNGVADVPIRYENQNVGVTDRKGRLLVPWVTAYYAAKFEIDPLDLPSNVATPVVEQRASVKRGSGLTLRFPMGRRSSANITLVDGAGKPLDVGIPVTVNDGTEAWVGWDGVVYIDALKPLNRLTATLFDGSSCKAVFPFAIGANAIGELGRIQCR